MLCGQSRGAAQGRSLVSSMRQPLPVLTPKPDNYLPCWLRYRATLSSSCARRRSTLARVKFLSRLLTALNLLPSMATLAVVRSPIARQSSTKRAHTLRSAAQPASRSGRKVIQERFKGGAPETAQWEPHGRLCNSRPWGLPWIPPCRRSVQSCSTLPPARLLRARRIDGHCETWPIRSRRFRGSRGRATSATKA
jgi:hypothetical protein